VIFIANETGHLPVIFPNAKFYANPFRVSPVGTGVWIHGQGYFNRWFAELPNSLKCDPVPWNELRSLYAQPGLVEQSPCSGQLTTRALE